MTDDKGAHWNYRVLKSDDEDASFAIHEVYYDEDNTPLSWSADAIAPYGDTLEELAADLGYMVLALGQPVLNEADLGDGEPASAAGMPGGTDESPISS